MKDFIEKHKDDIFRYVTYRKIWTPYEMEEKYFDESETECTYHFAKITDCVDLGSGDYLLELDEGNIDTDEDNPVFDRDGIKHYKRLSDIQLDLFDYDNNKGE